MELGQLDYLGHVLVLVLHVHLSFVVLDEGGGGDAHRPMLLVDGLGQFLDSQGEVKQLEDTDVGEADFWLAQAKDNVAWQDLVVHHHGEDVLALVKYAARWYRHVGKLCGRSRHAFLSLSVPFALVLGPHSRGGGAT